MPKKAVAVEEHDPEWDLDTMIRAEEIKADKKRIKGVKTAAKKREKALSKVSMDAVMKSKKY